MAITDRQRKLLDFIIREYVKTAEPVGSALVCEKSDFDVSSATVRNEMQALEESGYLAQPHTSAGRVPTDKAYRLFVNDLIEHGQYEVDTRSRRKIDTTLQDSPRVPQEINKRAARVVQELSENVVIAALENDFYKTGLSSLMGFPEFRELERTFHFMDFFDHFDRMFEQIEREFFRDALGFGDVNIIIGRENPFQDIRSESIIFTRYRLPHGRIGSLTVIGPTRMNYRKNIGLIQYTSDVLNKIAQEYDHAH